MIGSPVEWEGGIRVTPVQPWERRRVVLHAMRHMRPVCGTTAWTYRMTSVPEDVTCADCKRLG